MIGASMLVLSGACSAGAREGVEAQQSVVAGAERDTLIAAAYEIMATTRFAALVTLDESGHPRVRTMDPFLPDEDMVVWLGTNRRTRKVQEIEDDPRVNLYYASPDADGYVSVYGTARLVDDPAEKARRWKDEWTQFYPDREASYLLIAVVPTRIEIVSYRRGIVGDPDTWEPASIEFPDATLEVNPAN
jgi:general stress protein 26